MAAKRPYWRGQIRLSLVSFGVDLYSATKSGAKIAFNQIHKPTGKRIHYEKVVDGVGPVDTDDIVKGFQYSKGHYVLLTDEELDQVKLETKRTFELTQFVEEGEINPIYFERPYFVAPQDKYAEDAFRVVRDAMRGSKRIGLGQITLRGQEHIAALRPCGSGMVLETLHYANELLKAEPYFKSISARKSEKDAIELATTIIEKRSHPFDPTKFKDHYGDALRDLIERKRKAKGRTLEAKEEEHPKGDNVIDLMSALRESVSSPRKKAAARKPAARKAPAKRKTTPRRAAAKAATPKRKHA